MKQDKIIIYVSQSELLSDFSYAEKGLLLEYLFEYMNTGCIPKIECPLIENVFNIIVNQQTQKL